MAAFLAASLFSGILLSVPALVILRNLVTGALLGGVGIVLPYQALEVAYSHRKRMMVLVTMIRTQPELGGFLVVDPRGRMAVSLMAAVFIAAGYFIKLMVTREGDE